MKHFSRCLLTVMILGVCILTPILTLLLPQQTVSYFENRTLSAMPALTKQSLLDGSYFSAADTWLSNHLAGRNLLLEGYVGIQMALGKPAINDVLLTDQGVLLPLAAPEEFDPAEQAALMDQKTAELKALSEYCTAQGAVFCFVGLPEQRYVFYDAYPDYLAPGRQTVDYAETRVFDALAETQAVAVNMTEVFADHGGAEVYYSKLDHHFNYDGALLTYQTMLEAVNAVLETPLPVLYEDDLIFHTDERPFFGTYSRKLCNLQETQEHLVWAEPAEPVSFTRTDDGVPVEAVTYSQPTPEISAYAGYMGGDIGETILKTDRTDLPRVLVFGDSFTNPIEGLLYASCSELRSLDLRYYTDKTLYEYIAAYQPDLVIAIRDHMNYNQFVGNGVYR